MKATATPRRSLVHFLACVVIAATGSPLCGSTRVVAAGNESPSSSIDSSGFLLSDRSTKWNPGMMGAGGIPVRTTVCATLTPAGGTSDDTARIQAAINVCPAGQVVQLATGTFLINSGNFLLINKGITLRGAGPGQTTLAKTDGAKPFQSAVGAKPSPLIVVGPSLFSTTDNSSDAVGSVNLTEDAAKGAYTVKVNDIAGFRPGQIVLLDEASGADWRADPQGRGEIWAASDWRVVWQKHKPSVQYVDDFAPEAFPTTPQTAGSWFSRPDRPTSEIKQIASIAGSTITFTTPIHISYRSSHTAQLSRYARPHVMNAGVEDLKLTGGDAGNLRFNWAAQSWAKNVDNTVWHDEGFAIHASFRIELREFYVHDAAWAQPGGGGYAISLSAGSSEVLIENGIAVRANKVIVARSAGAGSVIAYNYMDMGYINTQGSWIESGLNASHMVGPHHVLFEGNYGHNADSDNTHGNSIYLTFFRNHLRGIRAPFDNQAGGRIDDAAQTRNGPQRAAGLMAFSYWMTFAGNVLGSPGQMDGWLYETSFAGGRPGIWMLGWDAVRPYPIDAKVSAVAIRHGNFDYLTNSVKWDPAVADHALPDSLYLTGKPAFFNAGRGYVWPWVDAAGPIKLHILPAKARYDAGTPFTQP
jgi:Pectate lyase superfamily protein